MANLLALSPVLVLLLGALAVLPLRSWSRVRPIVVIVTILLSLALLQINARQSDLSPFLFPAFASAPDLDLGFDFAPAGLFFSSIALLAVLSVRLSQSWGDTHTADSGPLVTASGVVVFFLAANWTTLTAGWLLTDLGFLTWRVGDSPGPSQARLPWGALALSQFGSLIFLGAGVLVSSGGASLRFARSSLGGLAADLVVLAAWIRSGLYPFQVPIVQRQDEELVPSPTRAATPPSDHSKELLRTALTMLMGSYLLARALAIMQGDFAYSSLFYALALIAVGATALLVIAEKESKSELARTVLALGAPLLVIPFIAFSAQGAALVVWVGLGAFNLALIVLITSLVTTNTKRRPLQRILWGAAVLAAAGFPLTPAFLGRVGLYAAAARSGEAVLVLALAAGTTLALVPLWRRFLEPFSGEQEKPNWREYLGMGLVLTPMVGEGAAPFLLTSFFGREVEDAGTFAFDALYHSPNLLPPLLLLAAILLPLPLAFLIARASRAAAPRGWIVPTAVIDGLDLSGPGRTVILGLDSIGLATRQVSALIEQHPIGWILLAAIWVAVWLLNGLGGR